MLESPFAIYAVEQNRERMRGSSSHLITALPLETEQERVPWATGGTSVCAFILSMFNQAMHYVQNYISNACPRHSPWK